MSEFNRQDPNLVDVRAAYVEDTLRPNGVLHDIAQTVVAVPVELASIDAGNVLLPSQSNLARGTMLAGS